MSAPAPLALDRAGSGEPLLLIHPLGADRQVWAPVLDALTAEHDVLRVDLPGFGESTPLGPDADVSPPALARAVAATLSALGVERPHVAGCSLGGWVALELALAGAARSVTTINAAGLWPRPLAPKRGTARAVAEALAPLAGALTASPRLRRLALAGTVAHPERVPARDAAHLVRSYGGAPGFVEVNAAMRAGHFTGLADIDVPVTLANGDKDRLVGLPREIPPGVRTVTLHDCGHVPFWDDPEQVARVLLDGSGRGEADGRTGHDRRARMPRAG